MKRMKQLVLSLIVFFATTFSLYSQICNLTSGYVGNTFNGNGKWVQNYAEELDVASDGTMVTTSTWDEAGRCIGVWKDGLPVTLLKQPDPNDGCWGWGTATEAAAISDDYLYAVNCKNNLLRWKRPGYNYEDKTNLGESTDKVIGMTYSAGYLYMVKTSGLVEKRSVSDLNNVSISFTVTDAYDIAVDGSGDIWVLTRGKEAIKFDPLGVSTGVKITGPTTWSPAAINYDAYNNVLLVADNGPRRQVIKFNTEGTQVGTFGDEGGISGGPIPGLVGDLRFWNISGCGTDASGNIYVALNEKATSLRKFDPNGIKQWEVQGLFFVDQTSVDPASNGMDIYGVNEHMKYDYEKNTWSLHAITCDPIANPTDPRITKDGSTALMRRVDGNLLMFVSAMYAGFFDVYRFNGEIAVFCQTIEGIGWSALPDKDGNVWYAKGASIRKIPLTGFNDGIPVFGTEVVVSQSILQPFTGIERLQYDAESDVMYVGGWTAEDGNYKNDWGVIGSAIGRYPNWSTGNRTASNIVYPPKSSGGNTMKAMSVAGDYVFCGLSSDEGELYVYNAEDLSLLGNIQVPETFGLTGWLDIPFAIQAYKSPSGEYIILIEDDLKGKNILHRWCPSGDCTPNDVKYPDFVISDFEILNENGEVITAPKAGQTVRFRVKVTNQGTMVSPAGSNYSDGKSFKVKFNITNVETNATKLLVADTITRSLAPGESTEVVSYSTKLGYEWTVTKGKFSVKSQVNPQIGGNIDECNRTNNTIYNDLVTYDSPYIIKNLQDEIIDYGQDVTFSVDVLGENPIQYQWFINGVEQQNVNSNVLKLTKVQLNLNEAKIKVVATNQLGSITSKEVTLTVLAVVKLPNGKIFANSGNTTAGNAFDGNTTTFFDGLSEAYMGMDYGTPQKVVKIRFYPRAGWTARMIGGKFQGSNDNNEYTDLYTIGFNPQENAWKVIALENEANYRYYRYQGPVGGYGNVSEIEFWSPFTPNGLSDYEIEGMVLYPNPVYDKLFLSVYADKIIVTGIDGKELIISEGSEVDLSVLKKGIYIVRYYVGQRTGISKIFKK
ncbi:MAG: discoidin domain-containing protein [Paludibacter sp.]|nr:discoidin domain-containing protein [Paludibacter sp.]